MTKVTRLTEYMEIICDRPYTRDENHIISQNELAAIYDEFKSLLSGVEEAKIKSSQKRTSNDKLSAFIKQFAIQLYDYASMIWKRVGTIAAARMSTRLKTALW